MASHDEYQQRQNWETIVQCYKFKDTSGMTWIVAHHPLFDGEDGIEKWKKGGGEIVEIRKI